MKTVFCAIIIILTTAFTGIYAQDVESFEEAKKISAAEGKPILMEFLRPG